MAVSCATFALVVNGRMNPDLGTSWQVLAASFDHWVRGMVPFVNEIIAVPRLIGPRG